MAEDYVFEIVSLCINVIQNCAKGIILSGVLECSVFLWFVAFAVGQVAFLLSPSASCPFPVCVCVCLCFIIIVLSYVLFSFCFHFMPYFSGLYDVGLCYGSAEFIIICFLFFFYFYLGFSFCFSALLILDIIDFHDLLNSVAQQKIYL